MISLEEMFSLRGQFAIVTGAASGIGLAVTEVLSLAGAAVTMIDRDASRLDAECRRLGDSGFKVCAETCDVTDAVGMRDAFTSAAARADGRLDIVFANAGIGAEGGGYRDREGHRREENAIENYAPERWAKTLNVNLTGGFLTVREAARHMRPRRAGRIVLTTSVTAFNSPPFVGVPYPVSKAALARFMQAVALELAPDGILVNAIAPGVFVTNVGNGALRDPAVQARAASSIPLGRVGLPEEIKGLALLLASPASSYITGAHISIDGGLAAGRVDAR